MIIAHGPLGYLIAYSTRRNWQPFIKPTQHKLIYLAAFVGAIFPDIDLFYFYLVDSTVSHRQLITHSLLPYALLLIAASCFLRFWPTKRLWALAVIFFSVGAFSHLAADMLVGMAAIFSPLSDHLFGLVSIPWYRDSCFMRYNLVTNFSSEFVIIMVAVGTLVRRHYWWLLTAAGTIIVSLILWWLSLHNYKPDGFFYYSDPDQDGLLNAYDADLDGDRLPNVIDTDIDGDGQDNTLELYVQLFSAEGSLFDYSYGHFIEVPLRFGLVNPAVLINRLFANIGLFFGEEMTTDYDANPAGYISKPADNAFSETPDNWLVWLEHTNRTLPGNNPRQEYDLLFFASGYVALFTRDADGNDVVLDVHPSHLYSQYRPLEEIIQREGELVTIGRIVPKPVAKHY